MALLETTTGVGALLPGQWGKLVVEPVLAASFAFDPRIATTIPTTSSLFHMPVLDTDGTSAWVDEAEEIAPTTPVFRELALKPAKVAGLTLISQELSVDSSPAATQVVGESLARSIARRIDAAFFGNLAAPAPPGLAALTVGTTGVQRIAAGTAPSNFDAFAQAISLIQTDGGMCTSFVANPADALALSTLKISTVSAQTLLGVDGSAGTARTLLGVPLLVSPQVTAGTIWALAAARNFTVLRTNGVDVQISRDAFFTSDQVAVKATLRVTFGFAAPRSVVKIALAAS